jgi:peptide-methionine (S)-S-oxide reductase
MNDTIYEPIRNKNKNMKNLNLKRYTLFVLLFIAANMSSAQSPDKKVEKGELAVAYFASGCFWCVEAIYEHVKGVEEAVSGYSGGHTTNPTYKSTGTGTTGHAETVAVYYDPNVVTFQSLVEVYFGTQDPTTFGQNPDFGSAYRSVVFYQNEKEKQTVEMMFTTLNNEVYHKKMVTEIKEFEHFYIAEDYHQDFERLHPNQGYIRAVSIPRLNRFKKAFPVLLK